MLSSLSRKLSVLQTSSADNLAMQQFRVLISVSIVECQAPQKLLVSSHLSVVNTSHKLGYH